MFWKFYKKFKSQLTLACLKIVIIYPPKAHQNKVIIKLNGCKDIRRILLNKKNMKNLKPESANLPGKQIFSLMKVCACTTRNWSPNVKCFGLLLAFLRFDSAKDCRESSC